MGQGKKHLIGGRFLVKWDSAGQWVVKDMQGELHKISGVDPIEVYLIRAYKGDDVYWVLEGVKLVSSRMSEGKVVIKGSRIVSYSILEEDEFYINHYGQKFFGKIKVGEERDILIDGKYLEIRQKEGDILKLEYRFLGKTLTPMIEVIGGETKVACFPELNKTYSGSDVYVDDCWRCLNVWILKDKILRLYVLLENGEEFLVYEDSNLYLYNLPTMHRIEDVMVVYLYGEENEALGNLRRMSGFNYLYVKKKPEEDLYISFNLKRWEKIGKTKKLIFKGGEGRIDEHKISFQRYLFEDELEKLTSLGKTDKGKINLEDIIVFQK